MAENQLISRVVQWNRQRYSLKLEAEFWRALRYRAAKRSIGLNALVGQLASEPRNGSLASHLRTYCLNQAERDAAEAVLSAKQNDLLDLFDNSPSAAALLSENGAIKRTNAAFQARFGKTASDFLGQSFLRTFRVQAPIPLSRLWEQFGRGERTPQSARLAHIVRGHVTTAKVVLHPLSARRPDRFNVIVWIA